MTFEEKVKHEREERRELGMMLGGQAIGTMVVFFSVYYTVGFYPMTCVAAGTAIGIPTALWWHRTGRDKFELWRFMRAARK